ncbi:hypothetical protein IFR05_008188 [Cadophora sp. M221]|nr:hypothetical protein IFR05_008188 [Cadophora sp. M221]
MIFKQSGVVVPLPPGFAPRPPPALPPRPKATANEDSQQNSKGKGKELELGAANWGALWSIMKAPLEKKGKKSQKENEGADGNSIVVEPKDVTGSGLSGDGEFSAPKGLPPSPPRSINRGIERVNSDAATIPSYPQPEKWEALFGANSTPTPIFVALMSTIFSHLDPEHTGFLSPEIYSHFLETQGWKQALDREGEHSKEVADLELSLYFTDLNISHTLSVRTRDSADFSEEEPQSAVEGKIRNSMRFNSNMPMISRQGFIDLCVVEYLNDPNKAYGYLGRVVKEFGVWKELGDIPREVLPVRATPKLLRRDTEKSEVEILQAKQETMVGKSGETNDEAGEVSVAESTDLLRTEGIPGETHGVFGQQKLQTDIETSTAPESSEAARLVSPITIGSPVMPFQLKRGEQKIDALTQGEGFEPIEEEQIKRKVDDTDTIPASANTIEEDATDAHQINVGKARSDEQAAKKPSAEDLYGAD